MRCDFLASQIHENTAAHRDGSPYPLGAGHKSDPKKVGRTFL